VWRSPLLRCTAARVQLQVVADTSLALQLPWRRLPAHAAEMTARVKRSSVSSLLSQQRDVRQQLVCCGKASHLQQCQHHVRRHYSYGQPCLGTASALRLFAQNSRQH